MRLHAVTKIRETVHRYFLFTEDCALKAPDDKKMQAEINSFYSAYNNFSLAIINQKTEVMLQQL